MQLYITDATGTIDRPAKELKRFEKLTLQPGETKKVTFEIGKQDLAYYNTAEQSWSASKGHYAIHIAAASDDIRHTIKIKYE
ncbi:MAG: fibronectin type III-like domain-contianing protein [Bacteroidales bacterium]|nr:fibronectin type III-like domain-contianing protein [Bacteroidales bacterium]